MFIKQCAVVVLSLIVVLVGVLVACAGPTASPTPTATLTPTPTTTPTGALAQIIAGAKKEGTVTITLPSELNPASIQRLQSEIKERFGVDLIINHMPRESNKRIADAVMEDAAGATPAFDAFNFSTHTVRANKEGILETVDWKPLLLEGTNPDVVLEHPAYQGAIVNYTAHQGLLYNPEKVPADKVPRTMSELADPKWKGKVGIFYSPDTFSRWAFILGKEKVWADLRAILINKAIQGKYVDLWNRYLIEEVWMVHITSGYLRTAAQKGMPAAWQSLDISHIQYHNLSVRKGAQHPNAAKLVIIYLVSPAGARFLLEEAGPGNIFYPGNEEHDIRLQDTKQGIPEVSDQDPGLIDFPESDEFAQWQKELELIFKAGG